MKFALFLQNINGMSEKLHYFYKILMECQKSKYKM